MRGKLLRKEVEGRRSYMIFLGEVVEYPIGQLTKSYPNLIPVELLILPIMKMLWETQNE